MMSYANYLNLVLKSREKIMSLDEETKNVFAGVCFSSLLLAYPLAISRFLLYNHSELDNKVFRKKYENFYKEVKIKNNGRRAVFFYPFFLFQRWIYMTIIVITHNTGLQFCALLNVN